MKEHMPSCWNIWVASSLSKQKKTVKQDKSHARNNVTITQDAALAVTVITMQRFFSQNLSLAKRWNTANGTQKQTVGRLQRIEVSHADRGPLILTPASFSTTST